MPLHRFVCPEDGAEVEKYVHVADDLGAETVLHDCGSTMARVLSVGRGLTWFEEGRARVLTNLGHAPVTVTSHEQHKQLMRDRRVDWATLGQGRRGCWV